MNEIHDKIEAGKALLRKEGINFNEFKTRMRKYFVHPEKIDEDSFV